MFSVGDVYISGTEVEIHYVNSSDALNTIFEHCHAYKDGNVYRPVLKHKNLQLCFFSQKTFSSLVKCYLDKSVKFRQ